MLLVFSLIVICLALISGFLMMWRLPLPASGTRQQDDLKSDSCSPLEAGPAADSRLSIIVPARNEELRLPDLLASLREQNLQPLELLVVDDQSDDQTAAVAAAAGARVIRTNRLEDSWTGKSFACYTGAVAAQGDWLLFLDADTEFESRQSLGRLVKAYENMSGSGLLSVQPYHRVKSLYESFSAIFNVIVMAGMNVFTPWGKKIKSAGAFGPCIICSKQEYLQTGGHKAVSEAVMDDLALGELYYSNNLAVECAGGRGLISFRMYAEGFRQLFEGWTKSFATASGSTNPLVFALIIIWISGGYSTTALLIRSLILGDTVWIPASITAYAAYMLQFIFQTRRTGSFNLLLLIFYPVLHLFFTVLFIWSLFITKVLHTVKWRGRKIKV